MIETARTGPSKLAPKAFATATAVCDPLQPFALPETGVAKEDRAEAEHPVGI
jgi:hypothetical protein